MLVTGCARIEHAEQIGSEQEQIPFYLHHHQTEASLDLATDRVGPGTHHVITGFWLRPGGRNHFQFRDNLAIEFDPTTGSIVAGTWRSNYYNVGQSRSFEGEHDDNSVEGGQIFLPRLDGGTGWMTLSLGKEWWRTHRIVTINFRKYTNPSRFPTDE